MLHICPTMANLGLNILVGECLRASSSELLDMMLEQPENKKDVRGELLLDLRQLEKEDSINEMSEQNCFSIVLS